ncbi:MAG: hypothetical protein QM813_17020 [Verrucomicrobiota bacterium]
MNWEHIKNTLKGAWKSLTVWFAAVLAAAPLVLPMVQDNFKSIAPYIPDALESKLMQAIALVIVLLRIKSTVSLAEKGKTP